MEVHSEVYEKAIILAVKLVPYKEIERRTGVYCPQIPNILKRENHFDELVKNQTQVRKMLMMGEDPKNIAHQLELDEEGVQQFAEKEVNKQIKNHKKKCAIDRDLSNRDLITKEEIIELSKYYEVHPQQIEKIYNRKHKIEKNKEGEICEMSNNQKSNEKISEIEIMRNNLQKLKQRNNTVIESECEYPEDLKMVAMNIMKDNIDLKQAKDIIKGRKVQFKTYMKDYMQVYIREANKNILVENLKKIMGNYQEALDIVLQMCVNRQMLKTANSLVQVYEIINGSKDKQMKEFYQNWKNKIKVLNAQIKIGLKVKEILNDTQKYDNENGDIELEKIESIIDKYKIDRSQIIIEEDRDGVNITLEDILDGKEK